MSQRARILVIDDDPMFRSLLVSLLRKDYIVAVASGGAEGFNKALEHPPDIAVIDIQMPGWDGLKTLKAFRKDAALDRVKIVILTSDASKETVLAAIQGGANDYLIKTSFSKDEFYQKLEKLMPAITARDVSPERAVSEHPSTAATLQPCEPDAALEPSARTATTATSTVQDSVGSPADDAVDVDTSLQELIDDWK